MQCWLVKQEPETYSWANLVTEKTTAWTGVRNFAARNNLRAMRSGDPVLFYHSGEEKRVVGIARVKKEAYPDPTASEGDWSCVDIAAAKPLKAPVTLAQMKSDSALKNLRLFKQSRLSVVPLTPQEFDRIVELGTGKP